MDQKTTSIVAYLTWVGWLVAFLAGDKEGAKFWLNQSLVLILCDIALSIVMGVLVFIPIIGALISTVVGIGMIVFWVLGLIAAINQEEKPLPIIGGIEILK